MYEDGDSYLRDTCLPVQNRFKKYLDYFRALYDK